MGYLQKILARKQVNKAIKYLTTCPQLVSIIGNLPKHIKFNFSKNTPGIASFAPDDLTLTINLEEVDFHTKDGYLKFLLILAHELCHANQKNEGLFYSDLVKASFGDTFRIAKMMEMDARLLGVIIEKDLLKRQQFDDCVPSLDCQYYQFKLKQNNNDVSKANLDFILGYWKYFRNNSNNDVLFNNLLNSRYLFYMEQAYHQALLMQSHTIKDKMVSVKQNIPLKIVEKYLTRMNIQGIDAKLFLTNGFDDIVLTDDFHHGITLVTHDGDRLFNICPTDNPLWDKITKFEYNKPHTSFLKNGITGEVSPLSTSNDGAKSFRASTVVQFQHVVPTQTTSEEARQQMTLSALNIAIEKGDLNQIKHIVDNDPTVINRQTKGTKAFPMLWAIQNNNPEVAKFILSKKPNLLLVTDDNKSVLTELSKLEDPELQKQIQLTVHVQQKLNTAHAM